MSDFLWDARSRAEISIIFASTANTTNYLGSTNNLQIGLIALLFSYYKKFVICCKKSHTFLEIKVKRNFRITRYVYYYVLYIRQSARLG